MSWRAGFCRYFGDYSEEFDWPFADDPSGYCLVNKEAWHGPGWYRYSQDFGPASAPVRLMSGPYDSEEEAERARHT
jgi:hypothetical protein